MKKFCWIISMQFIFLLAFSQTHVIGLLCENLNNPLGIDVMQPRFSWQLSSDKRNVMQSGYEIRVSDDVTNLSKRKNLVWGSEKVLSDSSIHVRYNGAPLQPAKKYYWQVRVWDNNGKVSA